MVNIPIAYCKYDDYRQNEVKTLFVELCIKKARPFQESCFFFLQYRGRDLNPHSHHWPKDFKSFVSTDSTTAAIDFYGNRLQRYCYFLKYANKNDFLRIFFVRNSEKY